MKASYLLRFILISLLFFTYEAKSEALCSDVDSAVCYLGQAAIYCPNSQDLCHLTYEYCLAVERDQQNNITKRKARIITYSWAQKCTCFASIEAEILRFAFDHADIWEINEEGCYDNFEVFVSPCFYEQIFPASSRIVLCDAEFCCMIKYRVCYKPRCISRPCDLGVSSMFMLVADLDAVNMINNCSPPCSTSANICTRFALDSLSWENPPPLGKNSIKGEELFIHKEKNFFLKEDNEGNINISTNNMNNYPNSVTFYDLLGNEILKFNLEKRKNIIKKSELNYLGKILFYKAIINGNIHSGKLYLEK